MRQFVYYHPDLYRRALVLIFVCTMVSGVTQSFDLSVPRLHSQQEATHPAQIQPVAKQSVAPLKSLPGKDGSATPPQVATAATAPVALPQSAASALTLDGDARTLGRTLNAVQFGDAEWPALQALWTRESNWNPAARNRSSGACGIPQALPCSKIGGVNANGTSAVSASGQITWGLNYIKGRYGTPSAAWRHSRAYGWY